MPIVDVEIVTRPDEQIEDNLASRIADTVARVLGLPQGRTWVKVRYIPNSDYAEDGAGPPAGVFPVFVSILLADLPPQEEMKQQIDRLTTAVATACARPPENVHLLYRPSARGRTAFGGRLVNP
jgi:phenylpyruvate tautomerase PptA (4-oxalocrotonate tautomerase family)